MVPHALPEAIAPCYTLTKGKDTHDDADVVTDTADCKSQLSSQTSLARVEGKAADVVDLADIAGTVDIADVVSAVQGYRHQYHCH